MKLHKSQTGFSPLHILLLLVLVGIIGFTGWKVYDANKPANPATSTATSTKSTEPKKEKSKIPEGFVEYKNEELGFKFNYPKTWGIVEVVSRTGDAGTDVTLLFKNGEAITPVIAALRSADYAAARDASQIYPAGYRVENGKIYSNWQYEEWKAGRNQSSLVGEIQNANIKKENGIEYLEVENAGTLGDPAVYYEAVVNLKAPSKYPGISFSVDKTKTEQIKQIKQVVLSVISV